MRELETVAGNPAPAALFELAHFRAPFAAQVKLGRAPEILERPAGIHAQAEGGDFARAPQGRQFFAGLNRAFAFFQLLAVELGVGPILRAHAANIAGGTGPQTVKRAAAPVVHVVFAGKGGDGAGWISGWLDFW